MSVSINYFSQQKKKSATKGRTKYVRKYEAIFPFIQIKHTHMPTRQTSIHPHSLSIFLSFVRLFAIYSYRILLSISLFHAFDNHCVLIEHSIIVLH